MFDLVWAEVLNCAVVVFPYIVDGFTFRHLVGLLDGVADWVDFGFPQAQWDVDALASYIKFRYGKLPSMRSVYRYLKASSRDAASN